MSFGELDKALEAANKAVSLNPDLSRTQTVLGYAYLTQVNTKEAKATFEKAIELDQADPLPRLGLGLAKIRDGDLHEGRREIEIAATLDPGNSLIRSYLGKAYYEEKRDKMSKDQYKAAKEFDPSDPTPFFYDAIRKQTINRPVEALHDMQKAIELNDNRMIYRSELLLDADLAARSASLGRICTDLGFQQVALVEGWKSVNYDPADFSGHRFLADTYSSLPRHEIARVSELLQSQLLQPINITPVQPHLAESNLSILDGAGPADLSFNEFNPLFNRNRLALQLNGIAGSQNTFGDEVVFSGVQGKASFSVGQFHYETDGFRENNDQRQDIYNAFVQYSLSYKTSIQAEFRARDFNHGDLMLNFFGDFVPNERIEEETRSVRFGFHHEFSPSSDLIGSYISQSDKLNLHDLSLGSIFDENMDDDSYSAELQYLLRLKYLNVIGGAGRFNVDSKVSYTTEVLDPPMKFSQILESDIRHTNLYLYSYLNYLKNVTFTLGGSADFFEGGIVDRKQLNPKLGLTWNPLPTTTLRTAVLKTLKRTLNTNQTLEPTQVAGFNQFFDDPEATEAWRYGVAIDQNFTKDIYGGVEYSYRNMEVPFVFMFIPPPPDLPFTEIRKVDWKERFARLYIYWTPNKWLAFSAEYLYERFDREKEFVAGIENLKTHRFPLGLNFYHPSGLSVQLQTTYYDQEGKFVPQGAPPGAEGTPGSDQFWVVNASINYRLPKRLGLLTVGVKNLFDENFMYQDTDPASPQIQPKRLIFTRLTLAI